MALRREPERRYVSVALFSLDLRRYLDGLPVSATTSSPGYRARRFVARHRMAVAAAAFCFIAMAGGVAATAYQAAVARRHFQEVRALANQFLFEFENEIHDLPGATKARDKVIKTAQKYLAQLYSEAPGDPKLMREVAQGYAKLATLEGGTYSTSTGEYRESIDDFRRAIQLFHALGRWKLQRYLASPQSLPAPRIHGPGVPRRRTRRGSPADQPGRRKAGRRLRQSFAIAGRADGGLQQSAYPCQHPGGGGRGRRLLRLLPSRDSGGGIVVERAPGRPCEPGPDRRRHVQPLRSPGPFRATPPAPWLPPSVAWILPTN